MKKQNQEEFTDADNDATLEKRWIKSNLGSKWKVEGSPSDDKLTP